VNTNPSTGTENRHSIPRADVGTVGNVNRGRYRVGHDRGGSRIKTLGYGDGVDSGKYNPRGITTIPMDADIAGQIVAERLAARPARTAVPTDQIEVGDNDPADDGLINAVARLDYSTRQLVTGHPRQQGRIIAQVSVDAIEHGKPDPAGQDLDQDLTRPGRRDRKRRPDRILSPREHSESGLLDHCYLLSLPDSISCNERKGTINDLCGGFSAHSGL
jgi:hypothetical protein